jgi:competence protein ComEA
METKRRAAFLAVSLVICAALFYAGQREDQKVSPAAFLFYSSGSDLIRISGDAPAPGIYRVPLHSDISSVIKLTAPSLAGRIADKRILSRVLASGDIVEITGKDKQHIEIVISGMKANERMLLGIPLVADELDAAEWESLPGIGPGLAKQIINNRQKYGDFGHFSSLGRVPGLGDKRMKTIKKYFQTQ